MKSLTNEQMEERAQLISQLNEAGMELLSAVRRMNEQIDFMWPPVYSAQKKYNELLEKADEWQSQVHADMEEHSDNESQQWRESEEGQQYIAWMRKFTTDSEEMRLNKPQPMELPELDEVIQLARLPDRLSAVPVPK